MESENTNLEQSNLNSESEAVSLKSELENYKNRALYLQAEFDNYKRRMEKDQKSWSERVQENILVDLLPIVDNFELALEHMKNTEKDNNNLAGIELIFKELQKFLNKYKIQEITDNDQFNPELHEAVMQQAQEGSESGKIINVFKKGYKHNNKVIRPAQVSVVE